MVSGVAAVSILGSVAIIDRKTHTLTRTLVARGLPVWSAAFVLDKRKLLTGGADRKIRRWDSETGEPIGSIASGAIENPLAAYAGSGRAVV
jgi:cytochrome c